MDEFKTVGDLIDYLTSLGRDRLLIVDDDGSTFGLPRNSIQIWQSDDYALKIVSPVALFVDKL